MDAVGIARRLDAQDRLLHAILEALAPPDTGEESTGFEDLVAVLADLTEAVADVTATVRALRSDVCALSPPDAG